MLANTCLLVLLPACLPNAIINAKNQVYTRDKCGKRTMGHEIAQWDYVWNMVCRATYQLFSENLKSILLKFSQRIWIKYFNLRVIFYKSICFLKKYLISLGNSTMNSHLPHLIREAPDETNTSHSNPSNPHIWKERVCVDHKKEQTTKKT